MSPLFLFAALTKQKCLSDISPTWSPGLNIPLAPCISSKVYTGHSLHAQCTVSGPYNSISTELKKVLIDCYKLEIYTLDIAISSYSETCIKQPRLGQKKVVFE